MFKVKETFKGTFNDKEHLDRALHRFGNYLWGRRLPTVWIDRQAVSDDDAVIRSVRGLLSDREIVDAYGQVVFDEWTASKYCVWLASAAPGFFLAKNGSLRHVCCNRKYPKGTVMEVCDDVQRAYEILGEIIAYHRKGQLKCGVDKSDSHDFGCLTMFGEHGREIVDICDLPIHEARIMANIRPIYDFKESGMIVRRIYDFKESGMIVRRCCPICAFKEARKKVDKQKPKESCMIVRYKETDNPEFIVIAGFAGIMSRGKIIKRFGQEVFDEYAKGPCVLSVSDERIAIYRKGIGADVSCEWCRGPARISYFEESLLPALRAAKERLDTIIKAHELKKQQSAAEKPKVGPLLPASFCPTFALSSTGTVFVDLEMPSVDEIKEKYGEKVCERYTTHKDAVRWFPKAHCCVIGAKSKTIHQGAITPEEQTLLEDALKPARDALVRIIKEVHADAERPVIEVKI